MSNKQQSPISRAIQWCDREIANKVNDPGDKLVILGVKMQLQFLLAEEKSFAEYAFNAGQAHGEEISDPSYKATYETEHPDFDDYFKQYEP